MKYIAYFGSSALVAALLGYALLVDGEPWLGRQLVSADERPAAAKVVPKSCKRGANGAEQLSAESLARSL
jgi:hypothetical protein